MQVAKILMNILKIGITGHGYPSYQVNWNQDNSNQLYVQLNQTTSDASVAFFEMPVPVLFSGEGRDTLVRFDHHVFRGILYCAFGFQNYISQI
jgi:hypothetical protein